MARKLKPGHNPELYHCGNPACARTTPLALKSYPGYPGADVPEERIHRVQEPQMPGFALHCASCNHFTVVTPYPPKS